MSLLSFNQCFNEFSFKHFLYLWILGTSFSAAFSSIIENLDRINTDLAIIFFTDGQDTDTRNNLEYAKTGLKTALKEASYSTEVHSIGFTNEHDASKYLYLSIIL